MTILKVEEIGIKLIRSQKISREELEYIRRYYFEVNSTIGKKKFTEEEVIAMDHYSLPQGMRAWRTSILRRRNSDRRAALLHDRPDPYPELEGMMIP